jgi:hypothetical protein
MAEADAAPAPPPTMETPPPADQGAPPAPAAPASEAPARPEWLPEKFKTPEDLAKSYGELEKQRAKFAETAKATVRGEIEKELWGNRPETVDGYELALAEDAADVALLAGGMPEGFTPEEGRTYLALNPESPALGMLRDMAHRAGASPAEWQALMAQVARENGQRVPTAAEREAEAKAVYDALGEHGQRRVQYTWGALKTLLGDKAEALNSMAGSPEAIEAIEVLVERATGTRFAPPSEGSGPGGILTEAEIRAKMSTPEYLNGDQKTRDEVMRAWKALYPN